MTKSVGSFITLEVLQTLVAEIEMVLNDHPLTYQSADITDLETLTISHLLYGCHITTLPYPITEDDVLIDPTYTTETIHRDKTQRQEQLLQHYQTRWKESI